jgi:calcium-dependent protein kinase
MGCRHGKSLVISPINKISTKEDLKFTPGTFVHAQPQNFQSLYRVGEVLGKGSFSEVRRCVHKVTNVPRAVKIIRKTKATKASSELLRREIEILKALDHPNILKIYEFYDSPKRVFLVTELLAGGELFFEIIKQGVFSESKAAEIMRQILSALSYMHERNIAHRDLKPENILCEEKDSTLHIKLIDFGAAVQLDSLPRKHEIIGTSFYIAPEAIKGKYSLKNDLWSVGVILYIMLCGSPPFKGSNEKEVLSRVATGVYEMSQPAWGRVSEPAKDLVRGLLQKDPRHRYDVSRAMRHPWIQSATQPNLNAETMQQVMLNLKQFNSSTKMKDAIYTFITSHCLAAQDTKEMREAFVAIDLNRDGKLSYEELMIEYLKHMGPEQAESEVQRIFEKVDTDHSGYIDYIEFLKASVDSNKILSKQNLEMAFNMFDRDGSCTISADELRDVLSDNAVLDDEHIWQDLIEEVDRNGDGEIDLKEFEILLRAKI